MHLLLALMLARVTLPVIPGAAAPKGYVVISHPSVPVSQISKEDLSRIFLKTTTKWPDDRKIVPMDQRSAADVRKAFTEDVMGKSVAAIKNQWRQVVFAGRGVPPPEKASDEEVLAAVAATEGAIGYISSASVPEGVKVLRVTE